MDDKTAFHPEPAQCLPIAVTNVSSRNALPGIAGASRAIRIVNRGAADIFFEFGTSTVVATVGAAGAPGTAGSHFLPANQTEVFQPGLSVTHIAMITAAATATAYVSNGVGL